MPARAPARRALLKVGVRREEVEDRGFFSDIVGVDEVDISIAMSRGLGD